MMAMGTKDLLMQSVLQQNGSEDSFVVEAA